MGVEERVRQYLVDNMQAPREVLASDYPLITNRIIDSLGLLQLIGMLESEYDLTVQDEDVGNDNFGSLAAIAGYVESKLAAASSEPV